MASTYSDRLKLELMETGANANTWGNNTNTNLETLDAFTGGYLSKSVAGSANVTLTTANADPSAESSNKVIELTGALTGDIHVFIPAVENNYLIYNNTSGSQSVTVAATGHAANGTAISQGAWHWLYCDGASNYNVTEATFTTTNASALTEGTLADARLTANVTLNNASTISAGTLADARLTANVTLNNASTISAGTLSSDRLPTVPTSKGGTGLTSVGSAGQVLTVSAPGSALEFADAAGGGVGNTTTTTYNNSSSFNAPADIQFYSVRAIGGGGGGGGGGDNNYNATSPAPSGGSSAFGNVITASGGTGGSSAGYQGSNAGGGGGAANTNIGGTTIAGNPGDNGSNNPSYPSPGGSGGTSFFSPNVGKGGNGGPGSNRNNPAGAGGGGGGGSVYAIVGPDQVSNPISVNVGGAGNGAPGNNQISGRPGNAGQAGQVVVVQYLS
jgi:hypothetical protein